MAPLDGNNGIVELGRISDWAKWAALLFLSWALPCLDRAPGDVFCMTSL